MTVRLFALLAFALCSSCSADEAAVSQPQDQTSQPAEKTITIPLEKVWSTNQKREWALDEPVTRYIGELVEGDPNAEVLVREIRKELDSGSIQAKADPAFAVEGTDLEALKKAHAVLVGKQPRPTALPKGREISIAFFSLYSPYYMSVTDIKKRGNTILIRYEYIPHSNTIQSRLFALIPLGKLPEGHYQVKIDHEPYEKRFAKYGKSGPNELVLGRVSTSFEFDVE
jgi:hypothetical protein